MIYKTSNATLEINQKKDVSDINFSYRGAYVKYGIKAIYDKTNIYTKKPSLALFYYKDDKKRIDVADMPANVIVAFVKALEKAELIEVLDLFNKGVSLY